MERRWHFFTQRVVDFQISSLSNVVNAKSLHEFKEKPDKRLEGIPNVGCWMHKS